MIDSRREVISQGHQAAQYVLDQADFAYPETRDFVHGAINDLCAALAAADAQKWRPISEAPRDGTPVLGYHPKYGWVGTVRWDDGDWEVGNEQWEFSRPVQPTHWMPLPPPPGSEPADAQPEDTLGLRELAALKDGWDGYDAPPISTKALDTARQLKATPMSSGGLLLELHVGGKNVEIDVGEDGQIGHVEPADAQQDTVRVPRWKRDLADCLLLAKVTDVGAGFDKFVLHIDPGDIGDISGNVILAAFNTARAAAAKAGEGED